jgi:subtilisin family serine protease
VGIWKVRRRHLDDVLPDDVENLLEAAVPRDEQPPHFNPDDLIPHNFLNRHRFPATYNPDFLVLGEQAGPLEVQAVNLFLSERGYSGRLELPVAARGVVPVAAVTGADAKDICDVVRAARSDDARLPQLELNYRHQRATYERGYFEDMKAAGRVWGHGFAYIPFTSDLVPSAPPWKPPEYGRRPVIAVLDSGVDVDNPWFPSDEFLIERWDPPTPVQVVGHSEFRYADVEASHGTFIAGLIRRYAPDAQVRSLRIMREDGGADENNVVEALYHLLKLKDDNEPVDVVQMSFGRQSHEGDDTRLLDQIKELLGQLAAQGVQLVASAGNSGTEERVYPAAFAAEGVDIHSVGSGSSEYDRDDFSSHGTWVHDWFEGKDQIGPLLQHRWGIWSGTSFAVPRCAATLVTGVFPKQTA